MSEKFKLPNTLQKEREIEMQKMSFIANTRLQFSTQFLNTMIGRLDFDLTQEDTKSHLIDLSVDYANGLMEKLGMIVITNVE